MMAIMDSLDEWRQYLMGVREPFEIWTDHQNLQYFRQPQKLNRRQARWVTELVEYSFKLFHKPGSSMGKADILSRMTGLETGVNDNKDIVLLKPELFVQNVQVETPSEGILQDIRVNSHLRDKLVEDALEAKDKDWTLDDGILYWQNRIYVPKDQMVRGKVISMHHDTTLGGHPGQYKTWELVARNYWWPSMNRDIQRYVKGCEKCQATKSHQTKPTGSLHPHDIPTEPWETIGTDLIGELPEAGGYNAISVFVDHFTKRLRLVPTNMSCTSEGMAHIYCDRIFPLHGLPRKIVHD
jgi:hypothetical protein